MKKKIYPGAIIFDGINMLLMFIFAAIAAYPFIFVVFYAFSDPSRVRMEFLFAPKGLSISSFVTVFKNANILQAAAVSIGRSTLGPGLTVIVTSMAAYALTRKELLYRKFLLKYIVFTMYFTSGMIPLYILIKKLHLTGTFWVYILPLIVNVFCLIITKAFIEGIPKSLEESALIDGANDIVIFFRIIFPLCKPVIAAVLLFTAVQHWNMFFDTMIYNAQASHYHTLQYVLVNFISSRISTLRQVTEMGGAVHAPTMSLKMAITVITIFPILLVYPILQKHFVKGLFIGAVKG